MNQKIPLPLFPSRESLSARLRAFTLIELLTVIAIIGILAALIIPTVGSVRQSARSAQCLSNLRQIGMGFNLYASDNKGRFPRGGLNPRPDNPAVSDALWYSAITPYIQKAKVAATHVVYRCPVEKTEVDPARLNSTVQYTMSRATERSGSAVLATGTGAKLEEIPNPTKTYLVVDSFVNTAGVVSQGSFTYAQVAASFAGTPEASTSVSFRHNGSVNAVFVDGHTAKVTFADFKQVFSDPIEGRKLWDPFGKF